MSDPRHLLSSQLYANEVDKFRKLLDVVQWLKQRNETRPKLASDIDLEIIGSDRRCDGFSGAGNLVQVAREACLEQIIKSTEASQPCEVPEVNNSHHE